MDEFNEIKQEEQEIKIEEPKKISLDVPEIPLESFEIPDLAIKSEIGVENTYVGSVQFGVMGCGQAGGCGAGD